MSDKGYNDLEATIERLEFRNAKLDQHNEKIEKEIIELRKDNKSLAKQVEDQIKQGLISRDQAESFNRNVITQALGLDKPIIPYTNYYEISVGDYILICSDGLHGFLDDIQIANVIKKPNHDDIAKSLIEATLKSGSNDNISVVLVSF